MHSTTHWPELVRDCAKKRVVCVMFQLAMSALIRGNELELAACVGLVLGEAANQSTAYCLELLARKYMATPTWSVSQLAYFDDKFVDFFS